MARPYLSLDDYFARTHRPQADLAKVLGVTPAAVCRWTDGLSFPQGPHMLLRLSDETGIPVDTLVRAYARAIDRRSA